MLWEGPDCVADPFGNVPCRCFNRPRKRKGQIRKSPEKNRENTKNIGQVPKRTKKLQIGTPVVNTPSSGPLIDVGRGVTLDAQIANRNRFQIAALRHRRATAK